MKRRGAIFIKEDQSFCANPCCTLLARYPQDDPKYCYQDWPQAHRRLPTLPLHDQVEADAAWESHLQYLVRRMERKSLQLTNSERRMQAAIEKAEAEVALPKKRPAGRKTSQEESFLDELMEEYDG